MERSLLSASDYKTILERLLKTTEVQFLEAQFKPISENVEGYLGEHINLHVTFKHNNTTTTEILFLKAKPKNNKLQIDISAQVGAYKREIFVYDYLAREFEKYGLDTNFAPKCLFVLEDEALILENLSAQGYILSDRYSSYNMAQAQCGLRALATFHGAGIAYSLKKTTELQREYSMADEHADIFKESLYATGTNPTEFAIKWCKGSIKAIHTIIDLLPFDEAQRKKFTSMVSKFKFGACFAETTNYVKTCGHGDMWSNNMMFKYENGRPVQCRLFDFQICRFFYPAFDVLLFVFINTTPAFRRENLQELYKYYYASLGEVLAKQGYQLEGIMSFGIFLETVKFVMRDAMLQILAGVLLTHLPKELVNTFLEAGNEEKLEEFVYDNGQLCANAFKTHETYRNRISEAFQEYYDILLSYE